MINQKGFDQEMTRESELAAEECKKIKSLQKKNVFRGSDQKMNLRST